MPDRRSETIVPGLTVNSTGTVSVESSLSEPLIELALQLDEAVREPVDVQHIVAAIVLAARAGELDPNIPLAEVEDLNAILRRQLSVVFTRYSGRLGEDD